MGRLKVKICGMKYRDNIQDVLRLPIDYMGFIFYDKSKRYVEQLDLSVFDNSSIQKVGVFVNNTPHDINKTADDFQLDGIQLHGSETPEQCTELKETGKFIWKAFGIDEQFDFSVLEPYKDVVDCFLFDTKSPQYGGTGQAFSWETLTKYKGDTPYLLSGGIGIENLSDALHIQDERLFGLDLNSKLEVKPGIKNINLVNQAWNIIQNEQISSR